MKLLHFQDMHKIGDHYIKIKLTSFTKTNIKYFLSYVESNFDFFSYKNGHKNRMESFLEGRDSMRGSRRSERGECDKVYCLYV